MPMPRSCAPREDTAHLRRATARLSRRTRRRKPQPPPTPPYRSTLHCIRSRGRREHLNYCCCCLPRATTSRTRQKSARRRTRHRQAKSGGRHREPSKSPTHRVAAGSCRAQLPTTTRSMVTRHSQLVPRRRPDAAAASYAAAAARKSATSRSHSRAARRRTRAAAMKPPPPLPSASRQHNYCQLMQPRALWPRPTTTSPQQQQQPRPRRRLAAFFRQEDRSPLAWGGDEPRCRPAVAPAPSDGRCHRLRRSAASWRWRSGTGAWQGAWRVRRARCRGLG